MAGTDFLLEIATKMNGDDAVSELAKIGNSISEGKTKFAELERASASAAKGLERVGQQMTETRDKMSKAMAAGDQKAFWKLAAAADKLELKEKDLKASLASTKTALDAQASSLSHLADKYGELRKAESKIKGPVNVGKTGDAIGKLGGPLGGIGMRIKDLSEGFGELTSSIGKGGAIAAGAAVGVAALTAAMVAGAAAATAYAISMADQQRTLGLTLEAMTGSKEAGAALAETYHDIADSTGVGSARLLELTRELQKAKIGAKQIPDALQAIATQEMALGDAGGTADLIKQLEEGKTTAAAMADEMDAKFGDIVEKKMLGLGAQLGKLTTNFERMFDGLNIEPVLEGFSLLVALFDTNTESGQALQTLFGVMFDGVLEGESAFVILEGVILDCEFAALELAISMKKMSKVFNFKVTGGLAEVPDLAIVGDAALGSLTITLYALGAGISIVTGLVRSMLVAWNLASTSAMNVVKGLKVAWDAISSGAKAAVEKVSSIGSDIISGITKGITENASKVKEALMGIVKGAVDEIKEFLGINSPSRLFRDTVGSPIGEGIVAGIDMWEPAANDSMIAVVEPPTDIKQQLDAMSPRNDDRASGKGGGDTVHNTFHIAITGVQDAEDAVDQLERKLVKIVSGANEQMGARRRGKRRAA